MCPSLGPAYVADGLLDVVCFDAARRRDFEQWLDAPQDAQAPVTARQGKTVELVWADTANRLDDEFMAIETRSRSPKLPARRTSSRSSFP